MIEAMNIITNGNGYPIFVPNQVLKNRDLNSIISYLDSHNRLTRAYLIGMGILCGMEMEIQQQAEQISIYLTPGCGITSEGYSICISSTTLTHYQNQRQLSSGVFPPSQEEAVESVVELSLVELFTQNGDERILLHQKPDGTDRNAAELQAFLGERVLVIVLEPKDKQRDSCLIDCDDLGKDRNFALRFFLLPKLESQETPEDNCSAEKLLRQGYQLNDLGEPWQDFATEAIFTARHDFWQAFELRVQRFGYGQETPTGITEEVPVVRLNNITTYNALMANYYEICHHAIEGIAEVFPQLFRIFSPFFATFAPDTIEEFSGLENLLKQHLQDIWSPEEPDPSQLVAVEAQYAIQYFYDYLSHLVAAYRELAEVTFDLMDDCVPETRRFPKFLMLGIPDDSSQSESACSTPSPYRSHFVQPPIYNSNSQRVKQVRHLYERLVKLCQDQTFYPLPFYDTPLAITPSKDRSVPLSQQAIPYYLNYPEIYRYWNYDFCRKGISDRHPAYFYPLGTGSPKNAIDKLVHRLDAYNFYRIEGHIGEAKTNALEQIKDYQRRYNLAFDVITLKLSLSADLTDLNLSGHFDDLEADFGRMKDKFLKLWDKQENRDNLQERWSNNVFLNTMRREFFEKSGLLSIGEGKLFNSILALAKNPDNYQFMAQLRTEDEPTGRYWLYVINEQGTEVARYSPQSNINPANDLIDFSGLSAETIVAEQERIRETLAACIGLGKINFEVIPQSPNNMF